MLLRRIHRWLGLAISLLLLVISVSGILLLWKPEYIQLTVAGAGEPIITDDEHIAKAVQTALDQYEFGDVQLIQIHPDNLALLRVFLTKQRYAWHSQMGEVIEQWHQNERFENWLLDLHHRFLLGNTVGLNMAGFSGILLVPLVLLGFYLWWPNRRAGRFLIWPRGVRRGQVIRSHRNLGVTMAIPILFLTITGVILVYPLEAATLLLAEKSKDESAYLTRLTHSGKVDSLSAKISFVRDIYPEAALRWVRPPSEYGKAWIIGVQQAASWDRTGRTHITFHGEQVVEIKNARAQSAAKRGYEFVLPLHTGKLPVWYRAAITVFGLGMTIMIVLGVFSWSKQRQLLNNTN